MNAFLIDVRNETWFGVSVAFAGLRRQRVGGSEPI